MPSTPTKITTVLVIGASGSVGRPTIKHLLSKDFQVSALTRDTSQTKPPAGVTHLRTDYSPASLPQAFKDQDAIISTISTSKKNQKKTIIDAAITAGVKIFSPSEYGVDTSVLKATEIVPLLQGKIEVLNYLRSKQDQISWTALVTGFLFDWDLNIPSFGGINLPARTATIYNSGTQPYEATTLDRVGQAIAAALERPEAVENRHIYVSSFTVTQNQVVETLEKISGDRFAVSHDSVAYLREDGFKQLQEDSFAGVLALFASAFYGKFGVADYSATKGLWNDRLGLPREDLETFLSSYLAEKKEDADGLRMTL